MDVVPISLQWIIYWSVIIFICNFIVEHNWSDVILRNFAKVFDKVSHQRLLEILIDNKLPN